MTRGFMLFPLAMLAMLVMLVMLAMGCETDDFIIHGETDSCSSGSDEVELDEEPTTSAVMEAPLAEIAVSEPGQAGPRTPLDSRLPGATPAQEPR